MNVMYISYDGILDFVTQSQVLPYLEGLSAKGHEITLLTFEKIKTIGDRTRVSSCRDEMRGSKIDFIWLKYHKAPALPATIFDIAHGLFAGAGIIYRKKIEVLHARGYVAAVIAVCLKRFFGSKFIFDMRGFWPDEKVDAGSWRERGLLYKILKETEKYLLRKADAVVVLTGSAKDAILKTGLSKSEVYVIPCCTDLKIFRPIPHISNEGREYRHTILYAGNFGSFYDLDKILDFFKFLNKREKKTRLHILTKYPKDIIDNKAKIHGILKSDYLVEELSRREVPKAFSEADLSLIFYKRRLSGKGCCPIKLGESLASGVPVVISAGIGDCDDIVNNNKVGIVLKDYSGPEYEKALSRIRDFFSNRDQTRFKCRAVAEELFSLSGGVEKYNDVYMRLKS